MADSANPLDQVVAGTSAAAMVNANFDAASNAMLGGRRASTTTGLTWGYNGGKFMVNGAPVHVANGTVTLTTATFNFVGMTQAGVVVAGTSRNPAHIPLYAVTTGSGVVTAYTDERRPEFFARGAHGIATQALTTTNVTLSQAQALCETLTVTGVLTAQRDLVVPLLRRRWVIRHTGSAFGVQIIGATGTGVVVAPGMTAIVECDGTNVYRVTADV